MGGYDKIAIAIMVLTLFLFASIMAAIFFFSMWWSQRKIALSPYTGLPLRAATDLPYMTRVKVLDYMKTYSNYDNRPFNLGKALFCRDTGRIFPDSINWLGQRKVTWDFLQKRYPGRWVSWGSLTPEEKQKVIEAHDKIEGFQMEISCPNPNPEDIELKYIHTKPGPLYVDIETKVLLGWKCVPNSELEVLIVQKPKYI